MNIDFKPRLLLLSALCASTILFTPNLSKAAEFTDAQKSEIETIVKEMIKANPEFIDTAMRDYYRDQEEKTKQNAEIKLQEYKDYFKNADLPMAGNPDGDVTVVEYFDYNCGYCKKAYADIVTLLGEDKNLRVVFQEMPILSPSSQTMAALAMAAHKQGKYFEMHQALMDYRGPQTIESYVELAKKIGLDIAKLEEDAKSAETGDMVKKSVDMAQNLGIRGTPGFIIGGKVYP
ncbi:MAG: DsbA family protein, partial [Alphaproteobacteria bacterium]|nr:DsbA family protein [Alphaproteobacteria bacterium]